MVMDFLPAALFPNEERSVAEYMSAGVSMGGRSSFLSTLTQQAMSPGVYFAKVRAMLLRCAAL